MAKHSGGRSHCYLHEGIRATEVVAGSAEFLPFRSYILIYPDSTFLPSGKTFSSG